MIKVAIFTEGQTEKIFICEAIKQIAEESNYYIESHRLNGSGSRLVMIDTGSVGSADNHKVYFQIVDCSADNRVLSTIREDYNRLVEKGFAHIIGLRDIYPDPVEKLEKVRGFIAKYLPVGTIAPVMFISILEIEAWFIAENSHFQKLDLRLTVENIRDSCGVDIQIDSEEFVHPYETMKLILESVELSYGKSRADVESVVSALDIREYTGSAGDRAPSIKPLLKQIQDIFAIAKVEQ